MIDSPIEGQPRPANHLPLPKQRAQVREDLRIHVLKIHTQLEDATGAIEALNHPSIIPTDRQLVRDLMFKRLQLANVIVQNPDDITELSQKYKALEEQDQRSLQIEKARTNQYLTSQPRVMVNGMSFKTEQTALFAVGGKLRGAEVKSANEAAVSLISVPDAWKAQDAGGVVRTKDGIIRVVVTDGVTGCVLGQYAARKIREIALAQMASGVEITPELLKKIHQEFQTLDLPTTARAWIAHLDDEINILQQNYDYDNARTLSGYKDNLVKLLAWPQGYEDTLASSTVTAVEFNPQTGVLKGIGKSDSPIIIFKKDGSMQRICGNSNGVHISYHRRTDDYRPGDEFTVNTVLEPGEVAIIATDFIDNIKVSHPDDPSKTISGLEAVQIALQKNPERGRKDILAIQTLKDILTTQDPNDDETAICVAREN